MTPTQFRYLHAIVELTKAQGYPPSLRDIQERVGTKSYGGAYEAINRLVSQGFITKQPRVCRGIVVTAKGDAEYRRLRELWGSGHVLVR